LHKALLILLTALVPWQAHAHLIAGLAGRAHFHISPLSSLHPTPGDQHHRVAEADHNHGHGHSHSAVQRHQHLGQVAEVVHLVSDASAPPASLTTQLAAGSDLPLAMSTPVWPHCGRTGVPAASGRWSFLPRNLLPDERPPR
jgi:hypothetical protein